ncbi:flagellar biosynthetic protein FliR [Alphaproteobacteria bacterium LSUCC0684]
MIKEMVIAGATDPSLPGLDLQIVMAYLTNFFISSLRIGAFMIAAPFFGSRWVPLQVRIIMSISLATAIALNAPLLPMEVVASMQVIVIIMAEISIGLAAGLIMTIFFGAAMLAGEKIASSSGLSYAAQIDPNAGGQTPVVSQILYLFLMIVFVSVDGHLIAIRSMLESYRIMPVGFSPDTEVMVRSGIAAAGSMFFAATMIMVPITMILLFINVSIGIVTRAAPQLNLFSFGFPISLMGVFVILYFSADFLGVAMVNLTDEAIQHLHQMMGDMHHG